VTVLWDNIKPGAKINSRIANLDSIVHIHCKAFSFSEERNQLAKREAPLVYLLGFPYDYGSILHYGNVSFYLAVDKEKPILKSKVT
jgi:hypothetical protein